MRSKKRAQTVLTVLFTVLLTLGMTPSAAADSSGAHERPFKMEFSGTVEVVVGADWCDGLPWVGVLIVADEGHATHMGRAYGEASQCTNTATGEVARGEVTMIAANGDELWGTYSGAALAPLPDGTGQIGVIQIFYGGTGRFANATGEAYELASSRPAEGLVWGTVDGTIIFDASDRSS